MAPRVSRRTALGTMMLGGAAGVLAHSPLVLGTMLRRANGIARNRYAVHTTEGARMLDLYAIAVERMKALPPTDEFSWSFQASIHAMQMEHSSWWFLPWHRAYLWYFEGIVRQTIADALEAGEDFAMPYWPWEDPNFRALPTQMIGDRASPLFDSNRTDTTNGGGSLDIEREINELFGACRFVDGTNGFGGTWTSAATVKGALEKLHDLVHDQVGGLHMGILSDSPWDPVFWLHHCNVDRLWELWLKRGGPRQNPYDDPIWTESLLSPTGKGWFYRADTRGREEVATKDFLTGNQRFDYEYVEYTPPSPLAVLPTPGEDACAQAGTPELSTRPEDGAKVDLVLEHQEVVSVSNPPCQRIHVNPGPLTVEVDLSANGRRTLEKLIAAARGGPTLPVSVRLVVTGIKAAGPPGVTFRVFLNNPDVSAKTSSVAPNYVGTMSALMAASKAKMMGGHHNPKVHVKPEDEEASFDITPIVLTRADQKALDLDRILVTLVPVGAGGKDRPDAEVSVEGAEIRVVRVRPFKAAAPPGGGP